MKSEYMMKYLILALLLIPCISKAQEINGVTENTKNKEFMSVIKKNKEALRKLYEQCFNKKNMGLLQELISVDYVGASGEKGVAGFEKPIAALIKAFPDIEWKVEELIGEGDKVVLRQEWKGTHSAQFGNFAATGKTISNNGLAIYEFKDGKIVSTQIMTDRLGFLQQLGVVPLDVSLPPVKK